MMDNRDRLLQLNKENIKELHRLIDEIEKGKENVSDIHNVILDNSAIHCCLHFAPHGTAIVNGQFHIDVDEKFFRTLIEFQIIGALLEYGEDKDEIMMRLSVKDILVPLVDEALKVMFNENNPECMALAVDIKKH